MRRAVRIHMTVCCKYWLFLRNSYTVPHPWPLGLHVLWTCNTKLLGVRKDSFFITAPHRTLSRCVVYTCHILRYGNAPLSTRTHWSTGTLHIAALTFFGPAISAVVSNARYRYALSILLPGGCARLDRPVSLWKVRGTFVRARQLVDCHRSRGVIHQRIRPFQTLKRRDSTSHRSLAWRSNTIFPREECASLQHNRVLNLHKTSHYVMMIKSGSEHKNKSHRSKSATRGGNIGDGAGFSFIALYDV